jgi:hypothetical protein
MKLIMIHGGKPLTPHFCQRASWEYGSQFGYTLYAKPVMTDFAKGDFGKYLEWIAVHKPEMALACDWIEPALAHEYAERVQAISRLGIMPVVAAKHPEALGIFDASVRIAVSVPTSHMNDGWLPPRDLFKFNAGKHLHLLGGHPDQWKWLIAYYAAAGVKVESIDGNAQYEQAYKYGKFWSRWGYYREMRGKGYHTNALVICSMRNARRYLQNKAPVHPGERITDCKKQLGLLPVQSLLAI